MSVLEGKLECQICGSVACDHHAELVVNLESDNDTLQAEVARLRARLRPVRTMAPPIELPDDEEYHGVASQTSVEQASVRCDAALAGEVPE